MRLINSNFKTLKILQNINIFKISKIITLKIINDHIYLIEFILFQQIKKCLIFIINVHSNLNKYYIYIYIYYSLSSMFHIDIALILLLEEKINYSKI